MNRLLASIQTALALVAIPLILIGVEAAITIKTVLILLAVLAAYTGITDVVRPRSDLEGK